LKLICESQAVGQLTQLGAKPLTDPKLVSLMAGREPTTEYYLPAAAQQVRCGIQHDPEAGLLAAEPDVLGQHRHRRLERFGDTTRQRAAAEWA